jgi:hypothetical protein
VQEKKLDARLEQVLQMGELMGQTKAFTRVAARCSAAKAQALAVIHENKSYKMLGMDWERFCQEKLGIDRHVADQHIRNLKEFGPLYFDLSQLTPLTPARYRTIAPSLSEKGLEFQGEMIAFTEKNAPRLTAAVSEMSKAAGSTPKPTAAADAEEKNGEDCEVSQVAAAELALDQAVKLGHRVAKMRLSGALRVSYGTKLNLALNSLGDVQYDLNR